MSGSRLRSVRIDAASLASQSRDQSHEREVAIADLLRENSFAPTGGPEGEYDLALALEDGRLALDVAGEGMRRRYLLSLTPMRGVIRDYFTICDSYDAAVRQSSPQQIEALDMGRRGLHNEAGETLRERLHGKIELDLATARRLFTLICALYRRV